MSELIDYISRKILDAEMVRQPFSYIEVCDFVPESYYKSFISALPNLDMYKPLLHKNTLKNGKPTRFELSLSREDGIVGLLDLFSGSEMAVEIIEALCSERFKSILLSKFDSDLDVTPYPHLYKDLSGFNLPPHTDIVEKAITFGWYLPEDDKYMASGLGLFVAAGGRFKECKKIDYKPNVAFAFLRTSSSWHGATHHPVAAYERNSLFVTFYRRNYCKDGSLLICDPNIDRKEIKVYEY